MSVTETTIDKLTPDEHNANRGTGRGRYLLDHSLRQFGAGRSILVDKAGRVIAGNKTLEAAADIGLEDVVIVQTDGTKLVAVQRTDLDLDDGDDKARQLAYADNRASEVGLSWDAAALQFDLDAGLDLSGMFQEFELGEILADIAPEPTPDPGAQVDKAAELQEKWNVQRGQVWEIGRHRLMCGDSTDAGDVGRLGINAVLMVTDPPYGVEYDPMFRERALGAAVRRTGTIQNDDEQSWRETFELFNGDVAYVWHADKQAVISGVDLISCGFEIRATIIWKKPHCPYGQGHYHYQHEPCWYAVRKGKPAHWKGSLHDSTVWDIALDETVEGEHGTQKPIECMSRPIRNHEGDVYDPFLGSGTTLVACEQTGRIGYGMEIEPKYVAVTLERLAGMGLEPRLCDG